MLTRMPARRPYSKEVSLDVSLKCARIGCVSAQEVVLKQTAAVSRRTGNPSILARMVIREGKSFKDSALAAGYSESMSQRGLQFAVGCSSAIAAAVERETAQLTVGLERMKPFAVKRLYDEITNPKSALGIKAIEVAGRFKETDWFVRNTDINIGVFTALGEAGPAIDAVANVIPSEE